MWATGQEGAVSLMHHPQYKGQLSQHRCGLRLHLLGLSGRRTPEWATRQQKHIVSRSGGWTSKSKGSAGMSFLGPPSWSCPPTAIFPLHPHTVLTQCVCLYLYFLFLGDIRSGPTLMISFNPSHLLKSIISLHYPFSGAGD